MSRVSPRSEDPAVEVDCQLCAWQSRWPDVADARAAGAWHAYDAHPQTWRSVVGDRPPQALRPQRADEVDLRDAEVTADERLPWGGAHGWGPSAGTV